MTPIEKRIAIAKSRGWKFLKRRFAYRWYHPPTRSYSSEPPDYLNDTNAMSRAVGSLDYTVAPGCKDYIETRDLFLRNLQRVQGNTPSDDRHITLSTGWCFLRATAAQQADAYLITIGKLKL